MSVNQYLVTTGRANICFDCEHYAQGCSWTELDPHTLKPRFEPVPGWTAEKVKLNLGSTKDGARLIETYHITGCPNFLRTPYRYSDPVELKDGERVV
ncbi:MAG: hypothetical protein Q4P84_08010 [Elusimicrobiales bacterium]|nr:hypothetical protein [Elusimicrobiales bacterium]